MKKILVIALAVVLALGVLAFAACEQPQVVEGEYSYANTHDETGTQKYGCKVKVTVKGGVITAIEVAEDTATFFNLSANWTEDYTPNGKPTAGKTAWIENGKKMADSFVGLTVDQVNAIKVTCAASGEPDTKTEGVKTIDGAPAKLQVVSGATQSAGRLILAVQNALSKLAK